MTAFILIMLISNGRSTVAVTEGFSSLEACETARKHIAKVQESATFFILSQGCFKRT